MRSEIGHEITGAELYIKIIEMDLISLNKYTTVAQF